MDNICVWLQRIGHWLESGANQIIPYVGMTGGRMYNPPRRHLEVLFVLTGGFPEVRIGDKLVSIPCGHVTLHNVHFGNYSSPAPETTSWCMFLDVSGWKPCPKLAQEPLFFSMPVAQPRQLAQKFSRLKEYCSLPGAIPPEYLYGPIAFSAVEADMARRMRVYAALLELVAELLDNAGAALNTDTPRLPATIIDAQQFMAAHSASPAINLADIAGAAHLSIDHFGRLFKHCLGTTPMQYLRDLRINESRFLLAHTDLRVEEVASQVGFIDGFYFSRVFSSTMGLSPSQFRREQRAQISRIVPDGLEEGGACYP